MEEEPKSQKWYATIHKQKFILAMTGSGIVAILTGFGKINGADAVSAIIWINAIMGGWNVFSKAADKLPTPK